MVQEAARRRRRRFLQRWFSSAAARFRAGPASDGAAPFSSRVATWVGIASATIGGFLGLDTYRADVAKKVDQSVAQTFDMIEVFNQPRLADARLRVLSYVEAKRYCDSRIISRELIDNDFFVVLDFFDLAHACVEAGLCDKATANQFFAPYANYQWPILENTVAEFRAQEQSLRSDAAFAIGMDAFAQDPTPAPPCDGNF